MRFLKGVFFGWVLGRPQGMESLTKQSPGPS